MYFVTEQYSTLIIFHITSLLKMYFTSVIPVFLEDLQDWVSDTLLQCFINQDFYRIAQKKVQAFISVIEFGLVGFFTYYLFFSPKLPGKTAMTYIICFSTLFYLF